MRFPTVDSGRRSGIGPRSPVLLVLLVVALWGYAPPAASNTPRQLVYDVKHSVFGDIGTYTNVIETDGADTTVKTIAKFEVTALGVSMHTENAERTERWKGDRLVYFHGVTKKNGDTIEINGEANGDKFVIESPSGTITAPATVHPANPWSVKSLESTTMMRVDTGRVEDVKIDRHNEITISVDGNKVKVREYEITGTTHYKIWIDKQDIPVKFIVDDDSGEVTFTLKK
jgi:hypothetical protein